MKAPRLLYKAASTSELNSGCWLPTA